MDKEALQFTCRFSLPPNTLGYCGSNSAPAKFNNCIINGVCGGIKKELEKFIILHPYIKTISQITGLNKFSYEVSQAYWFGNDFLLKANNSHYDLLLKNFKKQGVPEWLIKELKEINIKYFIPTHLFQVLQVGVGRASGSVPYNINTINNCMIRWGKITKIKNNKLAINLNSLKKDKKHYKLIKQNESCEFNQNILPNPAVGRYVAVHWKQAVKILEQHEVNLLEFWTKKVLDSI